jgi:hypothetical protein
MEWKPVTRYPLSMHGVSGSVDLLLTKLRTYAGASFSVWLSPQLEVIIASSRTSWRVPEPPGDWLVGVYTMRAKARDIREDFLERIRELTKDAP